MAMMVLALVAGAAACSPAPDLQGEPEAAPVEDWTLPPRIESVAAGRALAVRGRAAPDARVVVRGPDGAAFAASADADGRFEIRVTPPPGDLLILTAETQKGQEAYPAPQRLLVVDGGRGPIALLTPGGATRRMDAAPVLAAVDSDGRMLILSGQVEADAEVRISAPGGGERVARGGPDGRWIATAPASGPARIGVAGAAFNYPGARAEAGAVRTVGGWSVTWSTPDGARQSTWLPDR